MRTRKKLEERPAPYLLPRRKILQGGLAGLAAALVTPQLLGCEETVTADAGSSDGGGGVDSGTVDAGAPFVFPTRTIAAAPMLTSLIGSIGALGAADTNDVRLPPGFTSRIIATTGQLVTGTSYEWHGAPDGGATFMTEDGGWIYASNSELPLIGGVGAVRFDRSGNITAAHRILDETQINCAGGKTPWHTWLSCEESASGWVYETDPWGESAGVIRPALGKLKHEAVAVDPVSGHLYLTEDERDGGFYRFIPDGVNTAGFMNLAAGALEIATVDMSGNVTWTAVPDPQRTSAETATRFQVPGSTTFRGGEGIWWHGGTVYFSTKRDTRVWAYEVASASMSVIYDGEAISSPPLTGVDNVTVSCCGDVLVAEDAGSMQIVAILPSGAAIPLMQIVGQDSSEITGPAFDPSGTRLYFSSQRGSDGYGITFEVTGPFHEPV